MIKKISDNVFQFCFKNFGSCVYLLKLKEGYFIIDTSTKENREELLQDLKKLKINPLEIKGILLTHSHYDHIENQELFHNAKILSEREIKELGIKVIKTPGHTSDSLCFLYKKILFSGDTLFHDGFGRTDLPTGNEEEMKKSLKLLKTIKYNTLCPGHV